jgi:hypothetical protein
MVNLPHGREIQGSLGVRSLFLERDTSAGVVEWLIRLVCSHAALVASGELIVKADIVGDMELF